MMATERASAIGTAARVGVTRRLVVAALATTVVAGCTGSGSSLGYSYQLGSDTVDDVNPATTYAVGLGVLTMKRGSAELLSARYARNTGLSYTVKLVRLVGAQQIIGGGPVELALEHGNTPLEVPGFHLRSKESDQWELVIFARLNGADDARVDGGTLVYRDGSGRHSLKLAGPIRLRRGTGPL